MSEDIRIMIERELTQHLFLAVCIF